jgi:zinc protease
VPTKASALPADLTGEKVIAKYIEAIGGAKKIQELKSVKMTMKATIQGTELTMTASKKAPGKSVTEVSMQGNVMQKSVTDGKEVAQMLMGQKAPVDPLLKKRIVRSVNLVPETLWLQHKC